MTNTYQDYLQTVCTVKYRNYDIVKAHGGDLKVETEEGEGSEFIITLPIK